MRKIFHIASNEIAVTRGDDAVIEVELRSADGESMTLSEGDTLIFTLRRRAGENYPVLLEKRGRTTIALSESDTSLPTGKYVYDVVLTTEAGERTTVIGATTLKILPNVTAI